MLFRSSRTTIFSPEGRLYQVEYAMEAISHAGTCLGIACADGIVLAAEKSVSSKLLEQLNHEKIYKISPFFILILEVLFALLPVSLLMLILWLITLETKLKSIYTITLNLCLVNYSFRNYAILNKGTLNTVV